MFFVFGGNKKVCTFATANELIGVCLSDKKFINHIVDSTIKRFKLLPELITLK